MIYTLKFIWQFGNIIIAAKIKMIKVMLFFIYFNDIAAYFVTR